MLHLSSADALGELRGARAEGVDVSVETCPHYLTLDAAAVPDGATQFKCCPPIRDRANQDRLWQALRDGDIDMIVSDHSPCTVDLKRLDTGDFGAAWGGIASVQLGLPVVWTAARARGHSLADVVRWMATAPGRPGRADRQGPHRAGRRRRPVRVRSGRRVRRRPGPAAAQEPGHRVRRATPDRRGPPDVAARPTRRTGRPAARPTPHERTPHEHRTTPRAAACPAQTELTTDRADVHRGVRGAAQAAR